MNAQGWIVMLTSVSMVLALVSYCMVRVMSLPAIEMDDIHGPLDIDTGDTQDAD